MVGEPTAWSGARETDPVTDEQSLVAEAQTADGHTVRFRRVRNREFATIELGQPGEGGGFNGSIDLRVYPHENVKSFDLANPEQVARLGTRWACLSVPLGEQTDEFSLWTLIFRGGASLRFRYGRDDGSLVHTEVDLGEAVRILQEMGLI